MLLVDIQKEGKERAGIWTNTATSSCPFHLPFHESEVLGGGDTGKVSRFIWVVKAQHPQVSRYWWLFWVVLGHLAQNYHLAWKERGLEYFLFDNIQTYGVNRNRVRKSEGKGGLTNFLQNKPCG